MTRSFSFLITAALVATASTQAFAQDALTLDAAVAAALAHNPQVRAAQAGAAAAADEASGARAGWLPRVGASEAWRRSDQPVFVFSSLLSARQFTASNFAIDALNHPDATGLFQASVGVEQLLFDGGRTSSGIRAAQLQRDIAGTAVDQTRAGLTMGVTMAYGQVLVASAQAHTTTAAVEAAEQDLARAERRRDAGTVTEADVLSLRVHMAQMKQRAIQAEADLAITRASLNRLMGAPLDRTFDVVEPGPAGAAPDTALAALTSEARQSRPELKRADLEARLAAAGRDAARAAYLPQVGVMAGVESNGLTFTDRSASWAVGAMVRWNLSLGGAEAAHARAAAESVTRAAAARDDAQAAVDLDVLAATRRLDAARARDAVGRAAVDAALESQRIIRERYETGLASVNDVLRASTTRLEAETQRVAARVDVMTAEAALRHAVGRDR